jgi:DNA topoisomerase-3
MQTAILAEKPSIASAIAAIVGATDRENGFFSGSKYVVTWAYGHLVQLALPEDYGFSGFVREHLPILPEPFILKPRQVRDGKAYKPDAVALRQLKIIQRLFERCDRIVIATDSGREGELIFRYIYHYLNYQKPFVRLWISSLTDRAIRDGLQNRKDGSEYDRLYLAAKARSEADWMVGINASQALSIAAGHGVFSLGRVQTPTLAMVCRRYLENKSFVSIPFWQIRLQTEKAGTTFAVLSRERYPDKDVANSIFRSMEGQSLEVRSVERKEVHQEPPLLYDLTALQKEANEKHGFSADKTLSMAQRLYEQRWITYPRTSSRYIPADVFDEIPERINSLKTHPRLGAYASLMNTQMLNIRSVDDTKVSDHHALLITENIPNDLSDDEQTVYEMIAGRMLEAFFPKCIQDTTSVVCACGDAVFEAKGSVIKRAGWRAVFGAMEESEGEGTATLPNLSQGDILPVIHAELLEKQTRPKPLHTEASLLAAMENAGKEIDEKEERTAPKEFGIGTAATRAAIIETLLARNYMIREKRSLVPTEKGMAVYETVKDKRIADVALTGGWENALTQIERGEMQPETFSAAIQTYTRQITTELLETKIVGADENDCLCPKCQAARVRFYPKAVKCIDPNCGLVIFRTISEKRLSDKQILELLTKGETSVIKGFKSKAGKLFDAGLKFDDRYKVTFDFSEKRAGMK